jgi:Zn-dependent peptidase ImmA (M78 family)
MPRNINPNVLIWAREKAGYSTNTIASVLKREEDVILSWESGDIVPTYSQLEKLATKYEVPVAIFYFPEPPIIDDPVSKFRRLPDYEFSRFSPDTYKKIKKLESYKDSIISFIKPDYISRHITEYLKPEIDNNIEKLAKEILTFIGLKVPLELKYPSAENAVKVLRHALEVVGIFTFKDSFKDKFISGICLIDEKYPVILLNNSNSFTRQLFTLAHETAHILLSTNGITDDSDEYIKYFNDADKKVEVFCNKLAAEMLVPSNTFIEDIRSLQNTGFENISTIAEKYFVSREVILRRVYESGGISKDVFDKKNVEYQEEYKRFKGKKGAGNYYLTKIAYLGENFTKIAFQKYKKGIVSAQEAANHLNINSKNIDNFERYIRW